MLGVGKCSLGCAFLTVWGTGFVSADSTPPNEGATPITFDCGQGYRIAVRVGDGDDSDPEASITLPSGTLKLPRVRSGSGARYADDQAEFWTKGDEALFTIEGEQQKRCTRSD